MTTKQNDCLTSQDCGIVSSNPLRDATDADIEFHVQLYFCALRAHRFIEVRSCFGSKLVPLVGWRYGDIKTSALDIRPDPLWGESAKQKMMENNIKKTGIILL